VFRQFTPCQGFGNLHVIHRQPARPTVSGVRSQRYGVKERLRAWLLADPDTPTLEGFLDGEYARQRAARSPPDALPRELRFWVGGRPVKGGIRRTRASEWASALGGLIEGSTLSTRGANLSVTVARVNQFGGSFVGRSCFESLPIDGDGRRADTQA